MSVFTGRQGSGAMRAHRERKRREAEERKGRVTHERTKAHRRRRCVMCPPIERKAVR
jgi:hypothetical protein